MRNWLSPWLLATTLLRDTEPAVDVPRVSISSDAILVSPSMVVIPLRSTVPPFTASEPVVIWRTAVPSTMSFPPASDTLAPLVCKLPFRWIDLLAPDFTLINCPVPPAVTVDKLTSPVAIILRLCNWLNATLEASTLFPAVAFNESIEVPAFPVTAALNVILLFAFKVRIVLATGAAMIAALIVILPSKSPGRIVVSSVVFVPRPRAVLIVSTRI